MAQWLGSLPVLSEDPSVPSIYIKQLTKPPVTPVPGDPMPFPGPLRQPHTCDTYSHDPCIHIKINPIKDFFKVYNSELLGYTDRSNSHQNVTAY